MAHVLICQECKKSFGAVRKWRKYCSRECGYASQRGVYQLKPIRCPQCLKTFQPRHAKVKFCSKECSCTWHHNKEERGKGYTRLIECGFCGKEFLRLSKSNKYCSLKCFHSVNIGEGNVRYKNGITRDVRGYYRYSSGENKGKYVHQVATDGNLICDNCGCESELVHHIDGDRSNNNTHNLQPLCKQCHGMHHGPQIRFWEYRKNLQNNVTMQGGG